MKKIVLFVPGFKDSFTTRRYAAVLKAIEKQGYRAKFVPIQWRYTTLEDWVKELETEYAKYDAQQTILAGFSFGAMTVLVVAAKRNPAELWLCSLSPYFADDIAVMKESWRKSIGKRRTVVFSELQFARLAEQIHCPTRIFVGEKEAKRYPGLLARSKVAARTIPHATLTIVSGVDHKIDDPGYIAAIVGGTTRKEKE